MNLFSPKWWVNMFITTFVTMFFIYLIKKASTKYNVPFVKTVSEGI
ncbi:hypothetical protein OCA23_30325 [Bacillus cereus]|nr:hypothetical protein [Bacillus cereus]